MSYSYVKDITSRLIKELGLDNCSTPTGNSTYIANTHNTFMKSLGIELSDDDKILPYLYWTPKQHKSPVKQHFITGSSKCTKNSCPPFSPNTYSHKRMD